MHWCVGIIYPKTAPYQCNTFENEVKLPRELFAVGKGVKHHALPFSVGKGVKLPAFLCWKRGSMEV